MCWAAGWWLLLLWLFLRYEGRVAGWLAGRSLAQQVVVAVVASLALLLPSLVAQAALGNWQMPGDWVMNAAAQTGIAPDPLDMESTISLAGTVLGMGLGLIWLHRAGGMDAGGPRAGVRSVTCWAS